MLRFTILRLMGLISILGVAMAALRYPSLLWSSVMFTLAIVVLSAASLIARFGRKRGFAIGFAICGWLYMGLAFAPWLEHHVSYRLFSTALLDMVYSRVVAVPTPVPPAGVPLGVMMPSTGTPMPPMDSDGMRPPLLAPTGPGSAMSGGMMGMGGGSPGMMPATPTAWDTWTTISYTPTEYNGLFPMEASATFLTIGHSLFALLCAVLGGTLTLMLHKRETQQPNSASQVG